MTLILCPDGLPEITIQKKTNTIAKATMVDELGDVIDFDGVATPSGWTFKSTCLEIADRFSCSPDFKSLMYWDSLGGYAFNS